MAVDVRPLSELLTTISDSLSAATTAFPEDNSTFSAPEDGISLLDTKNDLLLSYLQHLTFLILLRVQRQNSTTSKDDEKVVSKLTELRAYLDRGVRPLESKLRYQIDKVLRAAEDAERTTQNKANGIDRNTSKKEKKSRKSTIQDDSDVSASASDDEASSAHSAPDSDEEALTARPNPLVLQAALRTKSSSSNVSRPDKSRDTRDTNGIYKAPRLNPVSMPDPTAQFAREETRLARRRKNALLDEFISEEHNSAPTAQPSIGSNNTILDRGRSQTGLASRERNTERERREYEETNFTRLAPISKKERGKERARARAQGRDMFGGEDWTGLGGLGDRIEKSVSGRGIKGGVLERREKRRRETTDGVRGNGLGEGQGVGIGESFEKRRRIMAGREGKKGRRR